MSMREVKAGLIDQLQVHEGDAADDLFTQKLPVAYRLIREIFKTYLDITSDDAHILALWIIAANYKDAFLTFPILYLNASKGSGKTRVLKLIAALLPSSIIATSLTESALFRIAQVRDCILIDEAERLTSKEKISLKELLNSCYKKSGKILRVEGDKIKVVREFDMYRAVALANIWGLDSVLEDRCISIQLQKSNRQDIIAMPEMFDVDPRIQAVNTFFAQTRAGVGSYAEILVKGYNTTLLSHMGIDIHTYTHTQEPLNDDDKKKCRFL